MAIWEEHTNKQGEKRYRLITKRGRRLNIYPSKLGKGKYACDAFESDGNSVVARFHANTLKEAKSKLLQEAS